ncbi:MAG TPA: beta-galactosidase trimerization domain-containing protein [Planctomycetota bacterium]|nr:beta-galactosidase trimerization domain-containing protein [Planctomycetota bacterium]HRR80219.1 beta-galactosidase trimerization domain-containing protein [Planctomycetota bacterium]HRT93133.1 beta-galactosidase trimerization domain-containing protein [Planctomycetota bacterium]
MDELRFRQVHLDFHTSEHIPGVGSRFDPEQFVAMLKRGRVNSINCFSKCHHGWSYHPTRVGEMHPSLRFDLLGAMIEACHANDIKIPVYLSVGLDERNARLHPEWIEVGAEGNRHGAAPLKAGWRKMCFGSPYLDFVIAQVEEMVRNYDADGAWLDIIHQGECCCTWCLAGMEKAGLNPEKAEDRQAYARRVLLAYYQRMTDAVHALKPGLLIFHNSGHIPRGRRDLFPYFTHLELESLPTGGWGYDHFPISAKYSATTGFDFVGMTGKFHTTWGEFGGYKNPVALRYECAAMLAWGSKCGVGDQLHPDGHMDEDTYRIIGDAFAHVEAREPWCKGAKPASEAAILSVEAVQKRHRGSDDPDVGAARILLENHVNFDVVDTEADFARYRLLVLPDEVTLDDKALLRKVKAFVAAGGTLVLSGRSGMNAEGTKFLVDVGAKPVGPSPWQPDYVKLLKPRGGASLPCEGLVENPFVMYERAQRVKVTGAEVLAEAWRPYFNREFRHFCSHQHTPPSEPAGYPAALRKGRVLYFAHPVFANYRNKGQQLARDYVWRLIADTYGRLDVEVGLPSGGRVSLLRQAARRRHILHLLYATPINRGRGIEVIEDVVPLYDVPVSLKLRARRVTLVPEGKPLRFTRRKGRIEFTVPRLEMHQMIALDD